MIRRPPRSTLFPTRRSSDLALEDVVDEDPEALVDRRLLRNAEDARELVLERARQIEDEVRRGEAQSLAARSEEHTSELQSRQYLVCRLLLEKKNTND